MDDYSKEHLILKAMRGEFDFFERYRHLIKDCVFYKEGADMSSTFLANLTTKLNSMRKKFSEKDIKEFVENQLSAGKSNYSEKQLFRALSEVGVLSFLLNFISKIEKAEYEPELTKGNKNPEARFCFENDITFDIEVKTPGFEKSRGIGTDFDGFIMPNVVLPKNHDKLKKCCKENNIELIYPRILKLKSFIESAAKKFETPSNNKHFNLLFINWTYNDLSQCEFNEPISLLLNPANGILHNDLACKLIGLKRKHLDKISAICLYRDNIDSILTCDFRYHWANQSYKFILNNRNNDNLKFDLLCDLLQMSPYDHNSAAYPFADIILRTNVSKQIGKECLKIIGEMLESFY